MTNENIVRRIWSLIMKDKILQNEKLGDIQLAMATMKANSSFIRLKDLVDEEKRGEMIKREFFGERRYNDTI